MFIILIAIFGALWSVYSKIPLNVNGVGVLTTPNSINTIFSKLSGSIFFNEKILPLEFYRYSVNNQKQSSAAIPEILSMVEELNFSSKSLQAFCENVAESYLLDHKKEGLKIRKQLISEWREKFKSRSLSTEEYHTIDTIYREITDIICINILIIV